MIDLLDIPLGTRYVGIWEQHPVTKKEDIVNIIEEHLGIDPIGISICTYKDGVPYLLFLPFDFDSKDLKLSWEDAKSLYNYLIKEGFGVILNFSGKKGFHVFVPTFPEIYTRRQIRQTQLYFKTLLNLKTVDEQIFGDIRRLMRIGGTYNINGGLCKTIAQEDGKFLNLNDIIKDDIPRIEFSNNKTIKRHYHPYPCIEKYIKDREYWIAHHKRGKFEPSEDIRLSWAALRLSDGNPIEDILKEAESYHWDDWDYETTKKKIEYLSDKEWIPHSCKTLKELGYCIRDCKFVDENLNHVGII